MSPHGTSKSAFARHKGAHETALRAKSNSQSILEPAEPRTPNNEESSSEPPKKKRRRDNFKQTAVSPSPAESSIAIDAESDDESQLALTEEETGDE